MQVGIKKYFGQKSLSDVNMDEFLTNLGLYRKLTAKDASCLFRAVSEQLYYSQIHHMEIRKACVIHMRINKVDFESFVEGPFEKYLERLRDPKESAGQLEMRALSQLYKRDFIVYRYAGKPPIRVTDNCFEKKILLCCSNNGHYDSVYPKQLQANAALCQAILYELLYKNVFGVNEEDLVSAVELFRSSTKKNRSSTSISSEDANFDCFPERSPKHSSENKKEDIDIDQHENLEDKLKHGGIDDTKLSEGPSKMPFPYKVLKALDPEIYRNVEFDVWLDSRKELQKTDYMVFAGCRYCLGDKCQVRLENGGKYYNAHIQEVGHDSSFVTVFIEELAEKHTVPLGNLKPVTQVTPIPAWNAIPSRRGGNYQKMSGGYVTELEFDLKARKRMFKKVRGKEVFMAVAYSRGQPVLPPRLQQTIASGRTSPIHANPGGGNMGPYEQYRPHSTPQRHGRGYAPPRSCARFINRHNLIGPEVAYYTNPGKRCYQSYDNFSYRSRSYSRSRRQMQCMNKEYQYGYVPDDEEPRGMEETITFYEIEEGDETAYPDLSSQGGSSPVVTAPAGFWVTRQGPSPLPPGKQTLTSSSEEEVDAPSESDAGYQSPSVYAAAEAASNLSIQEGVSRPSPQDGVTAYSYSQQMMVSSAVMPTSPCVTAVPVTVFSSNSPSASQATATSAISSQTSVQPLLVSPPSGGRPVMLPPVPFSFHPAPSVPVNEMGKPVPPPLPPPPYSCDPSGSDLPLDTKVVQYYFNLGLQCYHQSYWQSLVYMQQHPPMDPYAPYPEASPVVDQAVPPLYSDIGRNNDRQIPSDTAGNNSYSSIESTSIPHGPVYYPVMQDPYNPASLPGYEPCVPVIPAYHYVGAWPSVNTAYGSSPRVHSAANPGPLHQVTYVTSTNPPPNYIQQNM